MKKTDTETLLDLMITRALHGLDDMEQDQLDQALLSVDSDQVEHLERELEAALALAGSASALERSERHRERFDAVGASPSSALIEALEADADRFFGATRATSEDRAFGSSTAGGGSSAAASLGGGRALARDPARSGRSLDATPAVTARSAPGAFAWTGWAVAALLLVTVWVGRPGTFPESGPAPGVVEARTALLGLDGTVQTPWGDSSWAEFAEVQGDVVWNDERQEGYLRLTNMPANDPTQAQYQLWIVDPGRDEEPVDGGVFDVPPGLREVLVPIRAKLSVRSPAAFAITREQPGGVVVSEGPLLMVASRG